MQTAVISTIHINFTKNPSLNEPEMRSNTLRRQVARSSRESDRERAVKAQERGALVRPLDMKGGLDHVMGRRTIHNRLR